MARGSPMGFAYPYMTSGWSKALFCRAWRVRGFADDQVVVIGHAVSPHRPGTVAREPHGGLIPTLRPAGPGPGAGAAP
jgi:hypothetical protein